MCVLRAPQRASGASSGKRETTSAPPWAAPRNARRRDAEARGPSRARVPAPTCVWVDYQTEPFEGRGKTKRTSNSIDDIGSNPERPEILDKSCHVSEDLRCHVSTRSTKDKIFSSRKKAQLHELLAVVSAPKFFFFVPLSGGGARSQERVLSPC